MTTIIKNGKLVTKDGVIEKDLLIEDDKIKAIGEFETADKCIDAKGKHVIPGLIDAHTHFNIDVGIAKSVDNFFTGTRAAACGGTTTIVDHMGFGPKGCDLDHQLNVYTKDAEDSVIDYGFHGVVQHVNEEVIEDMHNLKERGLSSYKVYMTYDYKLEEKDILKVMTKAKEEGIVITVHPELDGIIKFFKSKFEHEKELTPEYHERSRPELVEAKAIDLMCTYSYLLGDVPLYIVHITNNECMKVINDWRKKGLKNLFAETCPQYLFLDDSYYLRDDALKFILSPPLRNKRNNQLLWDSIENGEIDTIATDHCSFDYMGDKQKGKDDFRACPNGMPGVETRGLLMLNGIADGKYDIEKYVELCSTNPAKIFGMYPEKGSLEVGTDADIVILDLDTKQTITHDNLHENVDYTPFEGVEVDGKINYVISRGEVIVEDNNFIGEKGRGKYINRRAEF